MSQRLCPKDCVPKDDEPLKPLHQDYLTIFSKKLPILRSARATSIYRSMTEQGQSVN